MHAPSLENCIIQMVLTMRILRCVLHLRVGSFVSYLDFFLNLFRTNMNANNFHRICCNITLQVKRTKQNMFCPFRPTCNITLTYSTVTMYNRYYFFLKAFPCIETINTVKSIDVIYIFRFMNYIKFYSL